MEEEIKNYILDILMLVVSIALFATGIIKLSPIMSWLNLQWNSPIMQVLSAIHDYAGVALVLLVLIHLIFHRKWISAVTKDLFCKKEDFKKRIQRRQGIK